MDQSIFTAMESLASTMLAMRWMMASFPIANWELHVPAMERTSTL